MEAKNLPLHVRTELAKDPLRACLPYLRHSMKPFTGLLQVKASHPSGLHMSVNARRARVP
jgi:hypothetical protein